MADLSKIKGKRKPNRFGDLDSTAPSPSVLDAPESAPAADNKRRTRAKTGRTKTWGTTVAPDFPARLKIAAIKRGMSQVELLEHWLEQEEQNS